MQTVLAQDMQSSNLIKKPLSNYPNEHVAVLKNPVMYGEGNGYSGGSVQGAIQFVTPLADFMFDIEGTIMRFGPGWQEKIRFHVNAYGWSSTTMNYTANPIKAYWDKRLPDLLNIPVTLGNLSVNGSPKTTITIGDGNTNWGSYMVIVIDQVYLTNKSAGNYLYDDAQWELSKVAQVNTTENVYTTFAGNSADIASVNGLESALYGKANLNTENTFVGKQTVQGTVLADNLVAQTLGVKYSDGNTYQTIGADQGGLGTLYRSFITQGDVPIHRFQGSGTSDLLTIKNGGNVGIDNPLEKLAVNGTIRSKAVKVEPGNNWPDYVFEEGYKPLTLAEISAFVKEHKHLPEVPSAKEVGQKGIELGEMNKILLKKIEELTLILIEKDKQLKVLEQRMAKLEKN